MADKDPHFKILSDNRQAGHNYFLLERFESGMVLTGTEVKAIKSGQMQLKESYASIDNHEAWLHNAHISEYSHGNRANHAAVRPRKLLLHKSEIRKIFGLAAVKGNALVPLSFYWKNGKVKVALGVGKGKAQFDKREDLKEREADRELKRATMKAYKGR